MITPTEKQAADSCRQNLTQCEASAAHDIEMAFDCYLRQNDGLSVPYRVFGARRFRCQWRKEAVLNEVLRRYSESWDIRLVCDPKGGAVEYFLFVPLGASGPANVACMKVGSDGVGIKI